MKLPNVNRAAVPPQKITHYLLSATHRDGQHKAAFFAVFGFSAEKWQMLADALLAHARSHDVCDVVDTPFGRNYVVEGPLTTPGGREPRVRVVWFVANGQDFATLATAYPLD